MPVVNGTDWLLWVEIATVPTVLAMQRDISISESNETIDFSTKDQREQVIQGGRYSSEVTLEALFIPSDAAYLELRARVRSGAVLQVRTKNDGANDEEANCVVTSLDRSYPDQGASVVSATLAISGAWSAAV